MDIDLESMGSHRIAAEKVVQTAWDEARSRYPAASDLYIREVAMSILRTAIELGFARTCYAQSPRITGPLSEERG